MGRAGTKAGGIFAQNMQAGSAIIATDATGDGSVTVTFPKAMKNIPKVIAIAAEADTTGTLSTASKTNTTVSIVVDGSSVVSGNLSVDYVAFDDTYK